MYPNSGKNGQTAYTDASLTSWTFKTSIDRKLPLGQSQPLTDFVRLKTTLTFSSPSLKFCLWRKADESWKPLRISKPSEIEF